MPNAKTHRFPFFIEFWRHCVLRCGIPGRALPRYQSEGIKKIKYFFFWNGNRAHNLSLFQHCLPFVPLFYNNSFPKLCSSIALEPLFCYGKSSSFYKNGKCDRNVQNILPLYKNFCIILNRIRLRTWQVFLHKTLLVYYYILYCTKFIHNKTNIWTLKT